MTDMAKNAEGRDAAAWSAEAAGRYWTDRLAGASQLNAVLSFDSNQRSNQRYHRWTLASTVRLAQGRKWRKCLDLGCGYGRAFDTLGRLADVVVGTDVAPGMVKASQARGYADVVLGDAHVLPFPAGSFDLVVSLGMLEHIPVERLPLVVREVARVLSAGGAFIAETNNAGDFKLLDLPANAFRRGAQLPNGYVASAVDRTNLEALLTAEGFAIDRRVYNPTHSLGRLVTSRSASAVVDWFARLDETLLAAQSLAGRISDQVVLRARKAG